MLLKNSILPRSEKKVRVLLSSGKYIHMEPDRKKQPSRVRFTSAHLFALAFLSIVAFGAVVRVIAA